MQEEVKRDKRCMYSVRVAHKSRRTCSFCINSSPFSHRPLAKINSTILKLTPMGSTLLYTWRCCASHARLMGSDIVGLTLAVNLGVGCGLKLVPIGDPLQSRRSPLHLQMCVKYNPIVFKLTTLFRT